MTQYGVKDLAYYARVMWRHRRRHAAWQAHYEAAVASGSFTFPSVPVVTIIPTETCNLRCAMCNQWGEEGYYLAGARKAAHMDPDAMERLLRRELSPETSMLNVHGGEPLGYKHVERLLDVLAERQFDLLITTNGTMLAEHAERLARIDNMAMLISVDGDEESHDKIRGKGMFRRTRDGLAAFFAARRRTGKPIPPVVMGIVVCEWTGDAIEKAFEVARELDVFAVNYTFRYFMPEEAGLAYEEHLREHMGVASSGAWRGWVSKSHQEHDYAETSARVAAVLQKHRFRVRPPFVFSMPKNIRGSDIEKYFTNYLNVFGNESCFMPFYWARVHSNGDLIYCPGHPDVIAGNVFRDGFTTALNSETSVKFRRHILGNRMPICNRCCGLYMSYSGRSFEQSARRALRLPQVKSDFP